MQALYPLRFTEILRNYEFGGRWIAEAFDKEGLPADHSLAETWEVCDRPGESSVVRNGALSGTSLHELIARYGEALLGRGIVAEHGNRFPLLVKILDATYPLGEQVHPDDRLAREMGRSDTGKTEAWYMLQTRGGATVHCGTSAGTTSDVVRRALLGDTSRDVMEELPARPGDAFLLHAGTMHYSRGGLLFYEIMQNSDITISLRGSEHPAGTAGRKEWAERTLRAVRVVPGHQCRTRAVTTASGVNRVSYIFACRHFALERLDLAAPHTISCAGDRFFVLTVVEGAADVSCAVGRESLGRGHSCLLPAGLGDLTIVPRGPCSILKGYVPDLLRDVVEPLRAAGIADDAITALGAEPDSNPLTELVARPR